MEINKYRDIGGAVTTEAITEGRMVLKVAHTESHNYGSREDLPGVKLPDTADEAALARYVITWPVDNAQPPLYEPYPTLTSYTNRYGFENTSNVPFSAKVRLTQPSMQEGEEIPSGSLCLVFGPGTFTVPSGSYIYSGAMAPGTALIAADTATDGANLAGMLKHSATATAIEVHEITPDLDLTFRVLY